MMTRADWILTLLATALVAGLYAHLWSGRGPADELRIHSGDAPLRTEALAPDRKLRVRGALGDSLLEVRDERVRFLDSPCSGKHCVHAGWAQQTGQSVACLPNRVSVQLAGTGRRFDAINF